MNRTTNSPKHLDGRSHNRGAQIGQIRQVAIQLQGRMTASNLVDLGWSRPRAIIYLSHLTEHGRAKKYPPTGLPGAKWEPVYQMDLKFL